MSEFCECQLHCMVPASQGEVPVRVTSVGQGLRLFVRRRISVATKKRIRKFIEQVSALMLRRTGSGAASPQPVATSTIDFRPGDVVRIRSEQEIQATLDCWGALKGCAFMPEMVPYCDTTQRVLKPVEIFLDERDYRLRKAQGIVLLENLMCQGTKVYGRCDRSCFYFWRQEWLEKLEPDHHDLIERHES